MQRFCVVKIHSVLLVDLAKGARTRANIHTSIHLVDSLPIVPKKMQPFLRLQSFIRGW
jgi:hypothetical protein